MPKGNKAGRLPNVITKLPNEEIEAYGAKLGKEEEVLGSYGLTEKQIERAKKHKRWRRHWDIGYNRGLVVKAKEMYDSKDSAIVKLYADKVVPQAQEIEQTIEWKAPKWFYEELKVDKLKKVRRD